MSDPKLKFGGKAGESDDTINDRDQKIDVTDVTDEEKAAQDKFLDSLLDNEPLKDHIDEEDDDADTSGDDEEESEESDDEEEDEADTDEAESDDEEESEEGADSETEDESDEDSDDETQAGEGKFDGYNTFEEYKEAQKQAQETGQDEPNEAAKAYNDTVAFLKKNSEIIPASTVDAYIKYAESENNAFIHGDPHLYKLVKAVETISATLPYQRRLQLAYELAFKDEFIKKAEKAASAKTELRTQKVNKAAAPSATGSSTKGGGKSLSAEQINAFKRMGVAIPKNLRNK